MMNNKFTLLIILICFVNSIANGQIQKNDSIANDSSKVLPKENIVDSHTGVDSDGIKGLHMANNNKDTIIVGNNRMKIDTSQINTKKKGNPVVATLCSMVIPGLGQAYNKKYWKIPIIYSLFGAMYYFAQNNHQKYKDFKFAYKNFDTDKKPIWVTENIKSDYLKSRMEFYKRNRNFNIIIGSIFYLLNILDANVDAHLMDFDVGSDLSLRVEPELNYMYNETNKSDLPNFGMKFVFTLKSK